MMKNLRQTLFVLIAIGGLSLAASAQKNPQKPPPKEGKPPVVKPGKPEEKPKKPKKPSMGFMFVQTARIDTDKA